MAFEETGDWDKIQRAIREMPAKIQSINRNSLKKVALKGERIAVLHIKNQDLPWEPLSERYRRQKQKRGDSNKILVASTTYFQNITSRQKGNEAFAGVLRGVKSEGGESLANIAAVHEFGSLKRNIPRRPLWKPTSDELKAWVKRTNFMATEILKHLK